LIRKILRNPLSFAGCLILIIFSVVALGAPFFAPPERPCTPAISYWLPSWVLSAFGVDVSNCKAYTIPHDGRWPDPKPPSDTHLLGTTAGQYDILYGLIWGTRTAFSVGIVVVLCIASFGVFLGSVSGYFGRWVDELIMRVTEVFLSFPFLIAAIVLTSILGKGLDKIMIALIAFGWPTYARLVRGDILAVKEREYVQAARATGAGHLRIIFRHILPNTIYPVFVLASLDMGAIVLTAAALSFLGLGSEVGFADWGQMISFARNFITELGSYWWTVVYPGLAIVFFVLGWNLIGDAFRDILDPRMSGSR
jgi:peptide/nickel transport system permease protein